MKLKKLTPRKSKAQAIVEFAIALPVLLLLVYGLLEAGRLLFLYSTVVNASRQAVRYGSATGAGGDYTSVGGPNNSGVARYQDCYGIRRAATRGAYVATFDSVQIYWDSGPGTAETEYCTSGNTDTSLTSAILVDNAHRIRVKVSETYKPIVPKIVPFTLKPISAISSRTILLSVSIDVANLPTLNPSTPTQPTSTNTLTFTPTHTRTFTPSPTNTLTPIFTYTATSTPTITSTPTATFTPSNTPTPTNTPTPSMTPTASTTPIGNCGLVTHGPEDISGTTFSMTITNPTGVALSVLDVTVSWNHDAGHKVGANKKLRLLRAELGSVFWTGNIYATSYTILPTGLTIPTGTSTIVFTFDQTYTQTDGSERIFINLETNGCQLYPIDSNN